MWDFSAVCEEEIYEEYAKCAAPFFMETSEDEEREILQSVSLDGIELIA